MAANGRCVILGLVVIIHPPIEAASSSAFFFVLLVRTYVRATRYICSGRGGGRGRHLSSTTAVVGHRFQKSRNISNIPLFLLKGLWLYGVLVCACFAQRWLIAPMS